MYITWFMQIPYYFLCKALKKEGLPLVGYICSNLCEWLLWPAASLKQVLGKV